MIDPRAWEKMASKRKPEPEPTLAAIQRDAAIKDVIFHYILAGVLAAWFTAIILYSGLNSPSPAPKALGAFILIVLVGVWRAFRKHPANR